MDVSFRREGKAGAGLAPPAIAIGKPNQGTARLCQRGRRMAVTQLTIPPLPRADEAPVGSGKIQAVSKTERGEHCFIDFAERNLQFLRLAGQRARIEGFNAAGQIEKGGIHALAP